MFPVSAFLPFLFLIDITSTFSMLLLLPSSRFFPFLFSYLSTISLFFPSFFPLLALLSYVLFRVDLFRTRAWIPGAWEGGPMVPGPFSGPPGAPLWGQVPLQAFGSAMGMSSWLVYGLYLLFPGSEGRGCGSFSELQGTRQCGEIGPPVGPR